MPGTALKSAETKDRLPWHRRLAREAVGFQGGRVDVFLATRPLSLVTCIPDPNLTTLMQGYFNFADWLVIIIYLGGIVGLGVWFGKDQRNTRDYFLGSRNIPWWGIGVSIVAAETSALTIIGVPAIAYGGNIMFIQMIVGYVIARIILAVVMVPHYLSGEIYSPYQLLEQHLGLTDHGFCELRR